MNVPSFPTDNLYKFMTIAGLVLVVTTGIWFRDVRRELINRADDVHRRAQVLKIELEYLKQDAERERDMSMLRMNTSELRERLETNNSRSEEVLPSRERALQIKNAELQHENKILSDNIEEFKGVRAICLVISMVGFGIVAIGLRLWYTKLQVYQDRLVRDGKIR